MTVAPTNTRKYGTITFGTLAPWIVCAVLLLTLPLIFGDRGEITIMSQMAIMIVFALAYNMLLGQGGMLSFGHAIYVGMGSFLCLHVMNSASFSSIPVPVLPLLGGLFGLGIAMIIGSFSTRSAGTVFAMITLGIGELMAACVLIIVVFFGGEEGISSDRTEGMPFFGVEFFTHIEAFYVIAFWLLVSSVLMYLFSRTPVGRMANAVRDNPERAQFLGYSARWVRYVSFSASGFFCGIAGGLSAILFEIATESDLNVGASGIILLIVFLGGVGVFWGPALGAIIFILLQTVLGLQTHLWELYVGVIFVCMVMFFPGGIAGLIVAHGVAMSLGKLNLLIRPYLTCVLPGIIGALGLCGLVEMIFHLREAATGEYEMTLFWTDLNTHNFWPWLIFGGIALGGALIARNQTPVLKEAWAEANTIEITSVGEPT